MKKETKIVALGRDPKANFGYVNPPVYHASTILFPTLAEYEAGERDYSDVDLLGINQYHMPTYGRYGSPSTIALQQALAELEGADYAILTASGVSAISSAIMGLVGGGDHILMCDSVYGPTRRLCNDELKRFGVEVTYYDPTIGADIDKLIKPNTKVVYVESPGSLTFEVQDIPAIAKAAHARGNIAVVSDNTWATSYFTRPYELGVDVTVHSATKYISGHSDLVMGLITCKKEFYARILRCFRHLGACIGPDDVYMAQRGLRTLHVRLKHQEQAALELAKWLKTRPEVVKVLHPAFPECPGHEFWKRDFSGSSGLFTILLNPYSHKALAALLDGMEHFGMGYSWGGYESLMIPIKPGSIRTARKWTHDGLALRINVGLENIEDLRKDLEDGFTRLNAAT